MKFKHIKEHNAEINEAISIINDIYAKVFWLEERYNRRITEYNIERYGLIKSVKDIFNQKKCFTKSLKNIISEYNQIVMRYNVFDLEYKVKKEEYKQSEKLITSYSKLLARYKELRNSVKTTDNYNQYKLVAKKLDEQYNNLQATKTIYVNETKTEQVPYRHTRYYHSLFGLFPITHTEYRTETKVVSVPKEVADKEKRNQAKIEIEKIEKQLSILPNSKINNKIYNLDKCINKISSIKQNLIDYVKKIDLSNYQMKEEKILKALEDLKVNIMTEKSIISKCYPKFQFKKFEDLQETKENSYKGKMKLKEIEEWQKEYNDYKKLLEQNKAEYEL